MISKRRQAAIAALAATSLLLGVAGCGDDDDETAAPTAESAESAESAEASGPSGESEKPADDRVEHEPQDERERPGGPSPGVSGGGGAGSSDGGVAAGVPLNGIEDVVSPERLAEGIRRYQELREQLADDDPGNDEQAAAGLAELREQYMEAVAEAREGQPIPGTGGNPHGSQNQP